MLVVDGVELAKSHEVQCVVHLDAQPTVVGQESTQRSGKAQQIGNVGIDIVGYHEVSWPMRGAHDGGQFLVQEGRFSWHASVARGGSDIHRWLDAQAGYARTDHVLQQITVIAGDFDDKRFGSEPNASRGVVDKPLRVLYPAVGIRREVGVLR